MHTAQPAPGSSGNNMAIPILPYLRHKLAPSFNLELDSMKWNPYNRLRPEEVDSIVCNYSYNHDMYNAQSPANEG